MCRIEIKKYRGDDRHRIADSRRAVPRRGGESRRRRGKPDRNSYEGDANDPCESKSLGGRFADGPELVAFVAAMARAAGP